MDHPFVTYHNDYIESVWWALKEMWKKGLLYEGHKVMPYCPRCGTALSSHEVAQGYKDVKDMTCIAKFKVEGKNNTYILAWSVDSANDSTDKAFVTKLTKKINEIMDR